MRGCPTSVACPREPAAELRRSATRAVTSPRFAVSYPRCYPADPGGRSMQTVKYVYWEEDGVWLGYLQEFPDYWTQGETLDDLKEHLRDLHADLSSGQLPRIRKVDDLVVS